LLFFTVLLAFRWNLIGPVLPLQSSYVLCMVVYGDKFPKGGIVPYTLQ
jgi:hypothetical protein